MLAVAQFVAKVALASVVCQATVNIVRKVSRSISKKQ